MGNCPISLSSSLRDQRALEGTCTQEAGRCQGQGQLVLLLGYCLTTGSSFFPLCLRPHPLPLLPTLAVPQGFSDLLYLLSISNLTLAPSSRQPSLTAPTSSFPVFFLFTKHQSWVLFVASKQVWRS